MKTKYEKRGLLLEITGLVLLLIATFWEAEFSGWWNNTAVEMQTSVQEEVNLSVLRALSDIAALSAIDDQATVKRVASDASDAAKKASFNAIEMREERKRLIKGQSDLFAQIKLLLFCTGAIFVILGKVLFLRAYNSAPANP